MPNMKEAIILIREYWKMVSKFIDLDKNEQS